MGAVEREFGEDAHSLIRSWGFKGSASPQIMEHAANVLLYQGRRVGDIVVGLGIAPSEKIEPIMSRKPANAKTLDWLRECVDEVARRHDEILAIHHKICFVSQPFPGLVTHPAVASKDPLTRLNPELEKWNAVPVVVNGGDTMVLFSDLEKLLLYRSLGKRDRRQDQMTRVLVGDTGVEVLQTALMSNSVMLHYRQQISELEEGVLANTEGLQTLVQEEADGNPVINIIVMLLNQAIDQNINDVFIRPDGSRSRVLFRKNQRLRPAGVTLTGDQRDEVVRLLLSRSAANKGGGRLMAPADGNIMFSGKYGQAFLRLSFIPLESSNGEAISVSIRVLPRSAQQINMADLSIRPEIQVELRRLLRRKYGLVVVCGPTGSGKSTTIASMLCDHDVVYGESQKRMSVEEPVERMLPGVLHIDVSQHSYIDKKDEKPNKFAMALRAILRHDPDVLFVGEVRDKETCMVSVDSANTGHLVFTTTHANDPVLGYRRLASFMSADRRFDLVNVLEAILAQRLVTTICPHCSNKEPLNEELLEDLRYYCESKGLEFDPSTAPSHHTVANPSGCDECVDGYDGMIPVHGLMVMNPTVRNLLLSNDERDWLQAQSASGSKFTLFGAAYDLFKAGKIDIHTVML